MDQQFEQLIRRVLPGFFVVALTITSYIFLLTPTPQATEATLTSDTTTSDANINRGPACDGTKLDVAYLIDNSGTMNDNGANDMISNFTLYATPKFRQGNDQLAVLTFSYLTDNAPLEKQAIKQDFTTDIDAANKAVKGLRYGADGSGLYQGVNLTSNYFAAHRRTIAGSSQKVPGVVIVLTDAQTDVNKDKITPIVANDLQNNNIRYYWVSMGGKIPAYETLAAASGGLSFGPVNISRVQDVANSIFADIDRHFANCLSLSVQANKKVLRKGNAATLTYTYKNLSREDVDNATITHILPLSLVYDSHDNNPLTNIVSLVIGPSLKAGETGTKQADIKAK